MSALRPLIAIPADVAGGVDERREPVVGDGVGVDAKRRQLDDVHRALPVRRIGAGVD